ncbi:MAG: SO_0444 family Cu/Zn efflux transporter [Candidatus Hydrothermarchaeales archaeon]
MAADFVLAVIVDTFEILRDSSAYLLFGFLIAGLIHVYVQEEKIRRYLGGDGISSIIKASLIGAPLPLCSCGVTPTALGLYRDGASREATVSFLIATPETGADSISISYALLDPIMTVFRPIAAIVTAVMTGLADKFLGGDKGEREIHQHSEFIEGCGTCESNREEENKPKLRRALEYAFFDFLGDLSRWLIIGFMLAGAISAIIPRGMVQGYLGGGGLFPMLVMLVVGIPLYICATASTPIAAALIAKGLSPGAALVFLLAGPATNIATITIISKALGKRTTAIYVGSIAVVSVVLGVMLNWIYFFLNINPLATIGKAGEIIPNNIAIGAAILFLILLLNSLRYSGVD